MHGMVRGEGEKEVDHVMMMMIALYEDGQYHQQPCIYLNSNMRMDYLLSLV